MAYQITDDCMYCERCAAQCKAQALFFNGIHMEVDEALCTGCGNCRRICQIEAPYDRTKPPVHPAPHALIERECDMLAIGGGAVGLVSAAKLSEISDARIIVLEAGPRFGGGLWFAHTSKIYGSTWQAEHDCGDFLEEDFHKYMDLTRYRLDPRLVYTALSVTGDFFDWFYEGLPQEVKDRFEVGIYHVDGPDAHPVPSYREPHPERKDDCQGRQVVDRCLRICAANGVELLAKHRAVDVEVEDGKVIAVIAEDPGGLTRIECKCCIIGTGSWIRDRDVLGRYAPRFAAGTPVRNCHLNPYYKGDGIRLAERIGAYLDYDSFVTRSMGPFYQEMWNVLENKAVRAITSDPRCVYVNKEGRRWMDECVLERIDPFATAVALEYQPGAVSFTLFDSSILRKTAEQSLSGERRYRTIFEVIAGASFPADWQAQIDAEAAMGTLLRCGNTLRELAENCGIDPDGLQAAVERYNGFCAKGHDDDFLKPAEHLLPLVEGPYYALVNNVQTDGAFGGILINEYAQAYNKDRSGLIEGLYCGGDFASGRHINEAGVKKQVLNDESWACATAYLAALHMAEYLRSR